MIYCTVLCNNILCHIVGLLHQVLLFCVRKVFVPLEGAPKAGLLHFYHIALYWLYHIVLYRAQCSACQTHQNAQYFYENIIVSSRENP